MLLKCCPPYLTLKKKYNDDQAFKLSPSNMEAPVRSDDNIHRMEDKLNSIIPENPNKPYDVKEVIQT